MRDLKTGWAPAGGGSLSSRRKEVGRLADMWMGGFGAPLAMGDGGGFGPPAPALALGDVGGSGPLSLLMDAPSNPVADLLDTMATTAQMSHAVDAILLSGEDEEAPPAAAPQPQASAEQPSLSSRPQADPEAQAPSWSAAPPPYPEAPAPSWSAAPPPDPEAPAQPWSAAPTPDPDAQGWPWRAAAPASDPAPSQSAPQAEEQTPAPPWTAAPPLDASGQAPPELPPSQAQNAPGASRPQDGVAPPRLPAAPHPQNQASQQTPVPPPQAQATMPGDALPRLPAPGDPTAPAAGDAGSSTVSGSSTAAPSSPKPAAPDAKAAGTSEVLSDAGRPPVPSQAASPQAPQPSLPSGPAVRLDDLQHKAESQGDSLTGKAIDDLKQVDPHATTLTADRADWLRTDSGTLVQLPRADDAAPVYRILDAATDALKERQFDTAGNLTAAVDRSPRGDGMLTRARQFDGDTVLETRTLVRPVSLEETPDVIRDTAGFERLRTLLGETPGSLTLSAIEQEARGLQAAPATMAAMIAAMGDVEPKNALTWLLEAAGGLVLELVVSQGGGRKHLSLRNREGQVVFVEEEEDELDDNGLLRRRLRTTWDHLARSRGRRLWQYWSGRLQREEQVVVEQRTLRTQRREIRRYAGDIEQTTVDEASVEGTQRTVVRTRGDQLLYRETRTTKVAGQSQVETAVRLDVTRGLVGEERTVTTPAAVEKHAVWRRQAQTWLEYRVHGERSGPRRRWTVAFEQPHRAGRGEVVAVYDDGLHAATRLVRREATLDVRAADLLPAEARGFLQAAADQAGPTRQVALRRELRQTDEDGARWMLVEDCVTLQTMGLVPGAAAFEDRVVLRRRPGFGGEFLRTVEVVSETRAADGVREALQTARLENDALQTSAFARTSRVPAAEVVRLSGDTGQRLILAVLGRSDTLAAETMVVRGASDTLTLQQFSTSRDACLGRFMAGTPVWSIRQGDGFQALVEGTANTVWGRQSEDRLEIHVELPDMPVAGEARLVEERVEQATVADVDRLLAAAGLPTWAAFSADNATVCEFDTRIRGRSDLSCQVRRVTGNTSGARITVRTPDGDLLVLLQGGPWKSAAACMRGREGVEHFTVPHPMRQERLVLSCDETGVFGVHEMAGEALSLGRLGESFGSLLLWLQSGRPLERRGLDAWQTPLRALATAVGDVGCLGQPDVSTARGLVADLFSLAWKDDSPPAVDLFTTAGLSPLAAVCMAIAGAASSVRTEAGRLAPLYGLDAAQTLVA